MNRVRRSIRRERIRAARALGIPERRKWSRAKNSPSPAITSVAAIKAAGLKRVRRQKRNLMNVEANVQGRIRSDARFAGRYHEPRSHPWKRAR